MEANSGANICELVANYLLHELWKLNGEKDIGLHRDQALAVVQNKSGHE